MFFAQLQRDKSDKVFTTVLNVQGATITTGNPVSYQVTGSNDGVNVVLSGASGAQSVGFIGVAVKDIANNDYGLVQVAGFVNSVLISAVGTSLTIAQGEPLVPAAAGFFSAAPTYANSGFKFLSMSNAPVAVSAAAYASGLIKMI